ncbi:hypothetical protein GGI1_23506 [Acidithiobacillus sp. GGI-221]|nr:hypothetical protein GGI1_23506 [Acidithiobacillus sp. GGI-221]
MYFFATFLTEEAYDQLSTEYAITQHRLFTELNTAHGNTPIGEYGGNQKQCPGFISYCQRDDLLR